MCSHRLNLLRIHSSSCLSWMVFWPTAHQTSRDSSQEIADECQRFMLQNSLVFKGNTLKIHPLSKNTFFRETFSRWDYGFPSSRLENSWILPCAWISDNTPHSHLFRHLPCWSYSPSGSRTIKTWQSLNTQNLGNIQFIHTSLPRSLNSFQPKPSYDSTLLPTFSFNMLQC